MIKQNKLGSKKPVRDELGEDSITETRPERIPVSGQRDILTVRGKDPAYEYRFVKDEHEAGQRILRFLDAGYSLVLSDEGIIVGQNHVYKSENVGSLIRAPAGKEGFLYLMKQRKEFYEEDQTVKQEQILDTEKQMTTPNKDAGQYGSVSISN